MCVGESAANKCDIPPRRTAEGFRFGAVAMFLKEPETNTSLGPVCAQASGFTCVKNSDTMLYLTDDLCFIDSSNALWRGPSHWNGVFGFMSWRKGSILSVILKV